MNEAAGAEVLALEHRGWQALCDGEGATFYGALMTQDAVMVLAHGYVLDRQTVIESLQGAASWDSYAIDQPEVLPLGSNQILLRYTGTGQRRGAPDFVALMSSVYVRVDGEWRLAHYQQTPVPRANTARASQRDQQ